jgi:hypothetical protein
MLDFAPTSPQGLIDLTWLTLLHSAWLGLLAGSLASLATGMGRPASHRARHAAFVAALLVVATGAPAAALLQRSVGRGEIVPELVSTLILPERPSSALTEPDEVPPAVPPRAAVDQGWDARLRGAATAAGSLIHATRPYVLAAWAAAASAFGAMLMAGFLVSRRLRRETAPCAAPNWPPEISRTTC